MVVRGKKTIYRKIGKVIEERKEEEEVGWVEVKEDIKEILREERR